MVNQLKGNKLYLNYGYRIKYRPLIEFYVLQKKGRFFWKTLAETTTCHNSLNEMFKYLKIQAIKNITRDLLFFGEFSESMERFDQTMLKKELEGLVLDDNTTIKK